LFGGFVVFFFCFFFCVFCGFGGGGGVWGGCVFWVGFRGVCYMVYSIALLQDGQLKRGLCIEISHLGWFEWHCLPRQGFCV